jgi:zinc transport system ATP-binding protein
MLISANDISITLDDKKVLDSVSLNVDNGDLITIVGPNGAGKSTLIKCLLGVITPDSGEVTHEIGLRIGFVPQQFTVDKKLPIIVRDFLTLHKNPSTTQLQEVCEIINITHLLTKNLATLSGGETQKVLLARSLFDNPQVLVLDEVTAGMDLSGQLEFYGLLEKVWKKYNLAVLMVSHDLHMVMAKSKQVLCLFHHVCCSGKPSQVINNPEFIRLFGESIKDTLAIYNHQHDHTHSDAEIVPKNQVTNG